MVNGTSTTWFQTMANPLAHGYLGTPEEICHALQDQWTIGSSAWSYCVSKDGFHHVHGVVESPTPIRFSAVKKIYGSAHIEETKGSKAELLDYIYKLGRFEESDEVVLYRCQSGEIKGRQGHRTDLEQIQEHLDNGLTPQEIMDISLNFRRFEKMIRSAYFRKRCKNTKPRRPVGVHYIFGAAGSGKTHTYAELCEEFGDENVYFLSDHANGGFDLYQGESILFIDDVKADFGFAQLLRLLDVYRCQIHARYGNVFALWDKVYITSIHAPQELYRHMMATKQVRNESYEQLSRRLTDVTFCWKDGDDYHRQTFTSEKDKDLIALIHAMT